MLIGAAIGIQLGLLVGFATGPPVGVLVGIAVAGTSTVASAWMVFWPMDAASTRACVQRNGILA